MPTVPATHRFCTLIVLIAASAAAQVNPGDTINKASADKIKDLVSPGMYWCVQHGWPMKIVETKPVTLRKALHRGDREVLRQVKLARTAFRSRTSSPAGRFHDHE